MTDPSISGSAVIGETITMTPGTFSGGAGAMTQDDHLQVSDTGVSNWTKLMMQNIPATSYVVPADHAGLYYRAVSIAREDGFDAVFGYSDSIGPVA